MNNSSRSSREGGVQRGELWINVNMWISFPQCQCKSLLHSTNDTLRKWLMFSTENHNIILEQFGVWLTKFAEESFLTASCIRLSCSTAREENRLRKLWSCSVRSLS